MENIKVSTIPGDTTIQALGRKYDIWKNTVSADAKILVIGRALEEILWLLKKYRMRYGDNQKSIGWGTEITRASAIPGNASIQENSSEYLVRLATCTG